jgi:hypothetical protein
VRRPARWKQWAVFVFIAPAVSLAAYHFGSLTALELRNHEQRAPLPTVNSLYVEPQSLDIGEIWETRQHVFHVTIQNLGRAARTISRFQTTCGCLQLDPPGTTIAPGDKAEFTARLNLMHRQPYQMGLAERPVSVRLDPVFEGDFAATPGWEVKGVVRSRVSIAAPKLLFEDQCSPGGPRVWRKLRAKAHVPLKSLSALVPPKKAEVRVERSAVHPEEYIIFVSPNPSLPLGSFNFDVQLQAVTPDDEVHRCSDIEVAGEMQPLSRVVPRMVLLGEHPVPSEAEADVTLRLPAKDWKIDHIETDTTETLVTRSKAAVDEGVRLPMRQRITQTGDRVSTIRIVVRKPDKQEEIVSVEVRYHGEAAHVKDSR